MVALHLGHSCIEKDDSKSFKRNWNLAIDTNLGVGSDPVGSLRVIIALFDPFAEQSASHGVVPIVTASKAERVTTTTRHWSRFNVLDSNYAAAIWARAPPQEPIALKTEEAMNINISTGY